MNKLSGSIKPLRSEVSASPSRKHLTALDPGINWILLEVSKIMFYTNTIHGIKRFLKSESERFKKFNYT